MSDPKPAPSLSSVNSWLLFAGLAAVVLAVIALRTPENRVGSGHPIIGKKLSGLDFDPLTANAPAVHPGDLDGKVVLINFWGTWCPPCRAEFPHIVALYSKLRNEADFKLLAVSCNPGAPDDVNENELRETTQAFLDNRETDMPAYADLDGSARLHFQKVTARSMGYPTTIALDRTGTIRGMWEGYRPGTERDIVALIEQLLAER